MIAVIQCAAGKKPNAGHLKMQDGTPVMFVADPALAPASDNVIYARPDDLAHTGQSWRTMLLNYNADPGNNALGLLPAWELYRNPTYSLLAERVGFDRLYILSAGWGLISASFLTPAYDITFSAAADKYKKRKKRDQYGDFRMLPLETEEPAVFFGGKGYVSLFCELTEDMKAERTVVYNSSTVPNAPGCSLKKFKTNTRTNWHYECANAYCFD